MTHERAESSCDIAAEWDDNAAGWAAALETDGDPINSVFGLPAFLDVLGPLSGLEVLDAGCGEGRSSRHLAARGARVTGVDLSAGMLAHARRIETHERQGIVYTQASCDRLDPFGDDRFDLVVSYMALMDMAHLPGVMAEFRRVLRPGGRLAVAVRHPCYFTPGYSLVRNRDGQRAALLVADYFRGRPYQERLKLSPEAPKEFVVTRFAYTLSDYIGAMFAGGLALTSVHEPRPTEAMCARLPRLAFWRRHAALYLFLTGVKPDVA